MKLHLIVPAIAALVCASCEKTQEEDPFFKEPVPETFEFVNATVSYYGDTSMSGVSDLWLIELTDGTSHDDSGNTESAPPYSPRNYFCIDLSHGVCAKARRSLHSKF